MNAFHRFKIRLAAAVVIAASSAALGAQTVAPASQTDSITVSISLDKDHFPVGQSPLVPVTMINRTDRDLYLNGNWYRVHIEGENGEPTTTLRQRMTTDKLLPGEARLREDEDAEKFIPAGKSRIQKFEVEYFYDLSAPGKYRVYVDIKDPLSGKWLRTNTAQFEIQAPTR
ncbi:MAG: hypothetical protein ABR905_16675 [Terracidiphilus sp.]|jgi:hypothetical protein